jgi:hypothetical protein
VLAGLVPHGQGPGGRAVAEGVTVDGDLVVGGDELVARLLAGLLRVGLLPGLRLRRGLRLGRLRLRGLAPPRAVAPALALLGVGARLLLLGGGGAPDQGDAQQRDERQLIRHDDLFERV